MLARRAITMENLLEPFDLFIEIYNALIELAQNFVRVDYWRSAPAIVYMYLYIQCMKTTVVERLQLSCARVCDYIQRGSFWYLYDPTINLSRIYSSNTILVSHPFPSFFPRKSHRSMFQRRRRCRLHAVVARRLLGKLPIHLRARDNDPRHRLMPIGQRRRRSTRLFQQLDLVVRVSVTFNVRVNIDLAVPAFANRDQIRMGVRPVPVIGIGETVGARVRSELWPRSGELAVQDWQRGHDDAED